MSPGTPETLPHLRLNLLRIHSIPWYKLLAFKTASKHAHVQIISVGGCVNVALLRMHLLKAPGCYEVASSAAPPWLKLEEILCFYDTGK